MKYTRSLRYRITFSFFAFGLTLAAAIAVSMKFIVEDIEERLLSESLRLELEHFVERLKNDPGAPLLNTATLRAFVVEGGRSDGLPSFLRGASTGTFEVEHDRRHFQVAIDDVDGKRLYLLRDITLFEQRENAVFAALVFVVVASSIVALWVGFGLSQKVIAPVINLASTVARLEPEKPDAPISSQYAQDEVGELAQTFDHYLARLRDFIDREQEFTSNASHELRTPLTVINGAVELLSADESLPERSKRVLQRIQRAAKEMLQVVESLLFLAREQNVSMPDQSGEHVRVIEVVDEVIEDTRHLLVGKPVLVSTHFIADTALFVPKQTLTIVLGNLLRNAFGYTREGEVKVIVEADRIEVRDTGVGINPDDIPHVFERHYRGGQSDERGSGLGLSIVKRICERNRWRIEIDSSQKQGTGIIVHLKGQANFGCIYILSSRNLHSSLIFP